jgi:hypothetical protein
MSPIARPWDNVHTGRPPQLLKSLVTYYFGWNEKSLQISTARHWGERRVVSSQPRVSRQQQLQIFSRQISYHAVIGADNRVR